MPAGRHTAPAVTAAAVRARPLPGIGAIGSLDRQLPPVLPVRAAPSPGRVSEDTARAAPTSTRRSESGHYDTDRSPPKG